MTEFQRLTAVERTLGFARPVSERDDSRAWDALETPRQALEALIAEGLIADGPTYVLFSGGRDSSALLALTLHLAHRLGSEAPLPVTVRHPDAGGTGEDEWQELVLDHLQLKDQRILEFHGEQSWLGRAAERSLSAHGLLWPTASHIHGAVLGRLDPGAVIPGEGGDMTVAGRRITPLVDAVRAARPRRAARTAVALYRQRRKADDFVTELADASPWLTHEGIELAREHIRYPVEPLRWNNALAHTASLRPARMIRLNYIEVVRSFGHTSHNPLEHPRFVRALARAGGVLGLGDRTAMMRYLFGDLLPDAVLARTSKAFFNQTRWSERERVFAKEWNGEGVDYRYVDAARLRQEWLEEMPSTLSDIHLHAAWLAGHGLPLDSDGT